MLLNNIPNAVAEELLKPETLKKLALLENSSMADLDADVERLTTQLGREIRLQSGTNIRYIPVSHTLLHDRYMKVAQGKDAPLRLILYWDGFREFRTKTGTLGKDPSASCHSPHFPPLIAIASSI